MWYDKVLAAEIVDVRVFKTTEAIANVEEGTSVLVHAGVKNRRALSGSFKLRAIDDHLAIRNLRRKPLFDRDNLDIIILLYRLRYFVSHQLRIDLIYVFIEPVVGLNYDQTVLFLSQISLKPESGLWLGNFGFELIQLLQVLRESHFVLDAFNYRFLFQFFLKQLVRCKVIYRKQTECKGMASEILV